jgi:predicted permease
LWKPAVDEEVRREIEHHLDRLEQEFVARGFHPVAARAAAREKFGDAARIGAECRDIGERRDRDMQRSEWLAEFRQDVRYALRQIRANPRFTLVAVLTLAVGLGAMTTIFGIANAVLLRPLPGAEPDRLVLVSETAPQGARFYVSEPNYLDWRTRARGFTDLAAFSTREPSLQTDAGPERLLASAVTHSFFQVLGVKPMLGRTFTADEDVDGGDTRVVVLSHSFWERHYGGDPAALSGVLELDGIARRVIGVLPAGFDFPGDVDVWVPLAPSLTYHRSDRRLDVVARLAPGVTREQASTEVKSVARQLAADHPADNEGWSAQVLPFSEWYVSPQLERRVVVLLATVGLLLVMACVNVASLLLARAGARHREIAVRIALGAGGGRIVRQLLTESVVLSVIGAAIGVAFAASAIPVVRSIGSVTIPRLEGLVLDWRVLTFALGACLTTGILFGLAPAMHFLRGGRAHANATLDVLRSGSWAVGGGGVRNGLVVASVAMAMLLLVSAALVSGSFLKLMNVRLGFDPERVLTASIVVPAAEEGEEADRIINFYDELTRRLGELPGVRAAGAISIAPFSGGNTAMGFEPAHWTPQLVGEYRMASWRVVTPKAFAALGMPLIKGRLLSDDDRYPAPNVMLINETMARIGWPDEDPIGSEVRLSSGWTMTIVGVVGDTRHVFADSVPPPAMYFSYGHFPWRTAWIVMRTDGDPETLIPALRREVAALDPGIPVTRVQPLTTLVRETTAEPRLTVLVFAIFATAALVLAAIGLYGIVSYTVTQRTREIGVRMALGAAPGRIVAAVLGQGVSLAVLGVVLGGTMAYGAAGALRAILFETEPTDSTTFLAIGGMLVVVAAVASSGPAMRAARVDPLAAFRGD